MSAEIGGALPGFQEFQRTFTLHIRNPAKNRRPKGVPRERMAVYAEIVFHNMESTLAACFPVCKRVLGRRHWTSLVRRFLTEHRCATPLFREIPEEFLRWLEAHGADDVPPYIPQLAHYEWVELALTVSNACTPEDYAVDGDLMSGLPLLAPALMLLRYDWPVQRISPRIKPTAPLDEPLWLLVFRDVDDEVQFIELNAVSARLIAGLQAGTYTGRAALERVAEELQHPNPPQVIAFGDALLHELKRLGAILGTASCK
jgi:hypothetical protein